MSDHRYEDSRYVLDNPDEYHPTTRHKAKYYVRGYEDRTKDLLDDLKERRSNLRKQIEQDSSNPFAGNLKTSKGRLKGLNHIISLMSVNLPTELKSEEE